MIPVKGSIFITFAVSHRLSTAIHIEIHRFLLLFYFHTSCKPLQVRISGGRIAVEKIKRQKFVYTVGKSVILC